MKIPIFPGKYHQNGGFSMAMLVYRSVLKYKEQRHWTLTFSAGPVDQSIIGFHWNRCDQVFEGRREHFESRIGVRNEQFCVLY